MPADAGDSTKTVTGMVPVISFVSACYMHCNAFFDRYACYMHSVHSYSVICMGNGIICPCRNSGCHQPTHIICTPSATTSTPTITCLRWKPENIHTCYTCSKAAPFLKEHASHSPISQKGTKDNQLDTHAQYSCSVLGAYSLVLYRKAQHSA